MPTEDAPYILIGVDFGSQYIRTGAITPAGNLIEVRREEQNAVASTVSARALADQLLASADKILKDYSGKSKVLAIGVGLPGLVNHSDFRIVNLPQAPGLVGIDLYHEFQKAFGLPVYFENDANAAAFAEMARGVAKGESDWLYLHIGAGVGAGLVLDGKLRRGKSGYAGEIGHINIDPEGLECACGSFGCLETMASESNIVRRTRLRLKRDNTSSLSRLGAVGGFTYEQLVSTAVAGDDFARMMLERTGHFIGRAVAGVINLLNLSLVAIGGAPDARPFLAAAIAAETRSRSFAPAYDDCRIIIAELGNEAVVTGAALLAQRELKN